MIGEAASARSIETFFDAWRRPRYRSIRRFAEEEIILATGQFAGQKFRCARQPYSAHWFDAIDSGYWNHFVATGPSQSGKTLSCFTIPICYYLFELEENVLAAVPDRDILRDKWQDEIAPIIESTRYAHLLPTTGQGSKGGAPTAVKFKNGATLRWMTGGGGDKSRASYTARILVITETDGFDVQSETSAEGSKLDQLFARGFGFQLDQRIVICECTVSTEDRYTWHTYDTNSTRSELLLPCPHCRKFVLPEREQLQGWQHAADEIEASEEAHFCCPDCGKAWTDAQRRDSNLDARLAHRGQHVSLEGQVVGDAPRNRIFGFRWSAIHNCLLTAREFGMEEWNAPRSQDPHLAELKVRQFIFTQPASSDIESTRVTAEEIQRRKAERLTKGFIPPNAKHIAIGVDVGKRLLHWTGMCFISGGDPIVRKFHVFDYGRTEVPSDDIEFAKAIKIAMANLYDSINTGWTREDYGLVLVDCRWMPDEVVKALIGLDEGGRWHPHIGLGDGHYKKTTYVHPRKATKAIIGVGHRYYVQKMRGRPQKAVHSDANFWKTELHVGLKVADDDNQVTLFDSADPNEHVSYSKHLIAEYLQYEFVPGKGYETKWIAVSKSNHWLDATYMARVGLDILANRRKSTRRTDEPFKAFGMAL